jgi:hypothetical protein
MTNPRFRLLALALVLVLAPAVLLGPAAGGAATDRVKPRAGDYESEPIVKSGVVYQPGAFAVVNEGGKRRIVSSERYEGIYYPDLGKCDRFDVPLATESIPISRRGRFSARERTPVKRGSLRVRWKGHWTKPGRAVGTLAISYRGCSSKIKWVGRRAASRR